MIILENVHVGWHKPSISVESLNEIKDKIYSLLVLFNSLEANYCTNLNINYSPFYVNDRLV